MRARTALHARTEWTRRCGVAWQGTKLLGVAREGDGFGELGFITGKPRPVGARAATHCHLLVFDGIRMGAMIALNGHLLGNATDQFLRYVFGAIGCILELRILLCWLSEPGLK